jgi:hypothetical protein
LTATVQNTANARIYRGFQGILLLANGANERVLPNQKDGVRQALAAHSAGIAKTGTHRQLRESAHGILAMT